MTLRRFLLAAGLSAGLFSATTPWMVAPAFADAASDQADARRPGQVARDAADELLRSLEKLVAELPRYGLPVIRENGDIVIRRINPPDRPAPAAPGRSRDTVDL